MMDSKKMLEMEPMDLIALLEKEVRFNPLPPLENEKDYGLAVERLNQATAFISYFKIMEAAAKVKKREAKRQKLAPEEVDRIMGIEEVFEAFKKVSEQQFENTSKIFTAKRLVLDEFKKNGKMV